MKVCPNCGYPNKDDSLFCGECGSNLNDVPVREGTSIRHESNQEEQPEQNSQERPILDWTILYSGIFENHSSSEAEEIFIYGTKKTTPTLRDIASTVPHPWLYARVIIAFVLTFFILLFAASLYGNSNAIPGIILVGSFAVPISTLILFYELNVWRNVSIYETLKTFLIGGCASLLVSLRFYAEFDQLSPILISLIEEGGKAIITCYFLTKLGKISILSGLLVGSAVGAGFAAFESAGYAYNYLTNVGWLEMMQVIFLRAILTPGGHVAWTAVAGAALAIAAKKRHKMDFLNLLHWSFLLIFVIPIFLHALWDVDGLTMFSYFVLIMIIWLVVIVFVDRGLREIQNEIQNLNNI